MSKHAVNKAPKPGAPPEVWERYALKVNGYELAGGKPEIGGNAPAEAIYAEARKEIEDTGAISGDYKRLRIALFVHQRRWRNLQASDDVLAAEQRIADVILEALQDAV